MRTSSKAGAGLDPVPRLHLTPRRVYARGRLYRLRATRPKPTPTRGVYRAGQVSREDYPLPFALVVRVWDGHGGEEGAGVGMQRVRVELVAVRQFDQLAEVHHPDAVADVFYAGELVREAVGVLLAQAHRLEQIVHPV